MARYVAPFAVFVVLLAIRDHIPIAQTWEYPVRVILTTIVLLSVSLRVIPAVPSRPFASTILGIIVFVVWVAPDIVVPSYREHSIFQNSITGYVSTSISPQLRSSVAFQAMRALGSTAIVPVIEELFWRGWLMRYIIAANFEQVPLGSYTHAAFWITALLFATEHGPFWDVGLVAGVLYNWWIIRTRNLADCILSHTVTNGCLALYVLVFNQWQYWL